MTREFSEDSFNNLQTRYPMLDKETATRILNHSKVVTEYFDDPLYNSRLLMRRPEYIMYVSHKDDQEFFFGEDRVNLIPDEEGIIFIERI